MSLNLGLLGLYWHHKQASCRGLLSKAGENGIPGVAVFTPPALS